MDIPERLNNTCDSSAPPDASGFVRVSPETPREANAAMAQAKKELHEELQRVVTAFEKERLALDKRINAQRSELFNLNAAYNQVVKISHATEARLEKSVKELEAERDSLRSIAAAAIAWRQNIIWGKWDAERINVLVAAIDAYKAAHGEKGADNGLL